MADQKLTQLTALTDLTDDDLFYVVDDPAGVPEGKGISWANIVKYFTAHASRCRAYLATANQSIPNATHTLVELNAKEYDNLGEYDTVNFKFTASAPGYYLIIGNCFLSSGVDNQRLVSILYKNGATAAYSSSTISGANHASATVTDVQFLNAADYIQLYIYQNAGVAKDIYYGANFTWLAIHKLS